MDGVLTVENLESAIGICGDNLHQYNPYTGYEHVDPQFEASRFLEWRNNVVRLLNTHLVGLAGGDRVLRVVMNTLPSGDATVQEFDVIKAADLP